MGTCWLSYTFHSISRPTARYILVQMFKDKTLEASRAKQPIPSKGASIRLKDDFSDQKVLQPHVENEVKTFKIYLIPPSKTKHF